MAVLLINAILAVTVTYAAGAKMEVYPPEVNRGYGETFTVDIMVSNIMAQELYAWEFTLSFHPGILEVLNVTRGGFLGTAGTTMWEIGMWGPEWDNDFGYVSAGDMLVDIYGPGATGSGVLATIEFEVKGIGVCILDLWNTELDTMTSGVPDLIPHSVADGLFDNRAEFVPPIANFSISHPGMIMPVVDQPITFDASPSVDPDGWIVSYDWDFGDGTSDSGMVLSHVFSEIGTYTVSLTVTDNDGNNTAASASIDIVEWMEGGEFPDILKAWPERYEWNEVAKGRELGLFGVVGNPTEDDFLVKVEFTIYDRESGAKLGSIITDPALIHGGGTLELSDIMDLRDTDWRVMRPHASYWSNARLSVNHKYDVFAKCYHKPADSDDWEVGFAAVDFGFKVLGAKHDVAMLGVTTNATDGVPQGSLLEIYVTVDNQGGNYDEPVTIVVKYKGLTQSGLVEERAIELKQQEKRTETFSLDTSGLATGPYLITVNLPSLTFEEDTLDNSGSCRISVIA